MHINARTKIRPGSSHHTRHATSTDWRYIDVPPLVSKVSTRNTLRILGIKAHWPHLKASSTLSTAERVNIDPGGTSKQSGGTSEVPPRTSRSKVTSPTDPPELKRDTLNYRRLHRPLIELSAYVSVLCNGWGRLDETCSETFDPARWRPMVTVGLAGYPGSNLKATPHSAPLRIIHLPKLGRPVVSGLVSAETLPFSLTVCQTGQANLWSLRCSWMVTKYL